jgi:tetratricopeptide (TPR) repeat protein
VPETRRLDRLIADLAKITEEQDRRAFVVGEPSLHNRAAVDELHAGVIRLAYRDVIGAARLEHAARALAEHLDDDYCRALSLRSSGHLRYIEADYEGAAAAYRAAVDLFEKLGLCMQSARTRSSAIQALSYLGFYDQALEWAAAAREVFEAHRDSLRLARLDTNVANMLLRQDRYDEALERYQHAYDVLATHGEPGDLAAVLSNMGVCYVAIGQFESAIAVFQRSRAVCERSGLSKLVAEIDYNIAWLYYLRGEYQKATELYRSTRQYCKSTGDTYHAALCDLDEAELLLDLNLNTESGCLARRAARQFARLGMRYERAKAMVNVALAGLDAGHTRGPMLTLGKAWRLFKDDGNEIWTAVIDQYRAVVCHREGRNDEAKRYCSRAEKILAGSSLTGKAALCDLMRAQIYREAGRLRKARAVALRASERLGRIGIRSLSLHASFLVAQLEEERGDADSAYQACQRAREEIECLRTRLGGEDVQVSFLKDKLSLYEMLVRLCLTRDTPAFEEAFRYMEEAKSRGLAELLALRSSSHREPSRHAAGSELQQLRRKLQGIYRQIERASYKPDRGNRMRSLQSEANRYEQNLTESMRELGRKDRESATLLGGAAMPVDEIRASIPRGAMLLQYYSAGETLYCAVLDGERFAIQPVARTADLLAELRLLRFQMSKARLGPDFLAAQHDVWYRATRTHLRNLSGFLIAPIRHLVVDCDHLIIAPHGPLHHLPFHALLDADKYLVDEFSISYAPSASVFSLCSERRPSDATASLIFGIPDSYTPEISSEVREIADIIPESRLFLGAEANTEALSNYAPHSRIVHLATHGLFRRDNPLFSAIQLGDSRVSLLDLYDFYIPADLVTLSGCSTAMNEVVGGDELIGLVRGFLYAGARSLVASLWEVHDASTAWFMKRFYAALVGGANKAASLKSAMLQTREAFPHPYHWAPFILVGSYLN